MTVVLLALDGSDESRAAAEAAQRLFGDSATYLAVNVERVTPVWAPAAAVYGGVFPYAPASTLDTDAIDEVYDDAATEASSKAAELADEVGVDAEPLGEAGDPVDAILHAAQEHAADVIVVGSGDKTWWRRIAEGSVSKGLTRASSVPVLVVPHHSSHEE
jgi:nucleotide-binding universal stress UspA family protein